MCPNHACHCRWKTLPPELPGKPPYACHVSSPHPLSHRLISVACVFIDLEMFGFGVELLQNLVWKPGSKQPHFFSYEDRWVQMQATGPCAAHTPPMWACRKGAALPRWQRVSWRGFLAGTSESNHPSTAFTYTSSSNTAEFHRSKCY